MKDITRSYINKKLFSQFNSSEIIDIPENMPDVIEIISATIDPKILSLKIINTAKGTSSEGQHLTGKLLFVEIALKQKMLYAANTESQSIHVIDSEYYDSTYIVISTLIEGTAPETLIQYNYLRTKINSDNIKPELFMKV